MPRINEHYRSLRASYLVSEIRRRTAAFVEAHPGVRLIDLGVGDVTRPLPPAVVRALHEAADAMARPETFRLTAFGSREHTEEAVERIRTRPGSPS